MKTAQLIHLKHREVGHEVRVQGVVKLPRLHLPFQYHATSQEPFDHDAMLESIEEKGHAWERVADDYHGLRDAKQGDMALVGIPADVRIIDCTIYPESHSDWHAVCIFECHGEQHEIRLRYEHPCMANIEHLKAAVVEKAGSIAQMKAKVNVHKEALGAIATKHKKTLAWK